jgi:hypothetical protein
MFYAYCRANAEVVTPALTLSGKPIAVEMSFESVRRKELQHLRQGYLMAELLDENDKVIPGFERHRCMHQPGAKTRLTLKWGNRSLPKDAAGRRVRLLLCFRDLRVYSVSH